MSRATSVLIVDDHQMFGDALHILLSNSDGIDVFPVAPDGLAAIESSGRVHPDVVLMDIDLPGMDGIEATRRLLAVSPTSSVVMITALMDPDLLARSVDAGATGFISKQRAADELVETVRLAAAGETVFRTAELQQLVGPASDRGQMPSPLTEREREILQYLASGMTTIEIAKDLFVSPRTVQGHVQNILNKLGARSKLEAVLIGLRKGYVRLASDTDDER